MLDVVFICQASEECGRRLDLVGGEVADDQIA